jgi:hypothetical protein
LDLSFAPFDRHHELTQLPGDLAVLMVGVAARQAASPTAAAQAIAATGPWIARADPRLLQPLDGAFNGSMAAIIVRWTEP